jgi:hypothetical protein
MRRLGFVTVVVSLLVAACGSAVQVVQRTRVAQRARPCSGRVTLAAGQTVDAWRMGAVHFLSAWVGVGVTASEVWCNLPVDHGEEPTLVPQAVRLAVTRNGGGSWSTVGMTPPGATLRKSIGGASEQVVATSSRRLWLLTATGRLVASDTGGATWTQVSLPAPVVQIALTRGPAVGAVVPAARLSGAAVPSGPGGDAARHGPVETADPATAGLDPGPADVGDRRPDRGGLHLGLDAAADPADDHHRWGRELATTAAPTLAPAPLHRPRPDRRRRTRHLVVPLHRRSGGRQQRQGPVPNRRCWRITSAVESIISPQRPGQITLAEPDDLAAGSSSRLWLATFNGLTESGDGGDRWSNVARNEVETYGDSTTIDGLSATLAWLLAPGGAMWRTTDGGHWRQLGPQHLL